MAQAIPAYNRFHNLSTEMLADAIGHADAVLKGAEAECKALKDGSAYLTRRKGVVQIRG
jgi:hypothetical protein